MTNVSANLEKIKTLTFYVQKIYSVSRAIY